MKRFIVEAFMAIILMALASDLLYLYYAGGWYDPIKFIEIAEVVLLYAIGCLGAGYLIARVYKEWRV